MNICARVLVGASALLSGCGPEGVESSYTTERAKVERVLQVEDDRHRFVAYLVSWKGSQVVVSDTLSRSHHREGDEIEFMAYRMAMEDNPKMLNFTLIEP